MLSVLQLVRGAVAKKDLVPALTHVLITNGLIRGGNGKLQLSAPCEELQDYNICVPAERFIKAVDVCEGEPELKITEGGRLSIHRGSFRAYLPLLNLEAFPTRELHPGLQQKSSITGALLPPLKRLAPFIGQDASRPWACGVLIQNGRAYATNNVIVASTPVPGLHFENDVVLPDFLIAELLRLGKEPEEVYLSPSQIVLKLPARVEIRSTLIDLPWPNIDAVLRQRPIEQSVPVQQLQEAVQQLAPFCPDPDFPSMKTNSLGVSTDDGVTMGEVGGMDLPEGRWRVEPLVQVLQVAEKLDMNYWPAPCPWQGNDLAGVLIGLRANEST